MSTISHQTALVYTMVIVSAADRNMTDSEILTIGEIVRTLPVFRDYDRDLLPTAAADCAAMLGQDEGLEAVLGLIQEALPERLRETAYALACDVAAADESLGQEELRLLEIIRHRLDINRLHAAAIEKGAAARYAHA
ncbi:tellurite resistance TerB family protein [Oceanibacterium hippocampi]|uniref:Tellurite resistance protein TerB n=1 Tax=Oceanibacterium hippocampi TaxID=745714 RepID=A0A1Y5RA55_9PROT|nr:tellurite resistance TerB family protein [Oceanibacterium hippocampi]SLN11958.1 Tellurite resistance protein TerB [Oceanibacterium hippocampi]